MADSTGRSLVVDEASFEEQFLRCQVCQERFDQKERVPKTLPCNHTFCLPCLMQVFDHSQPTDSRRGRRGDEERGGHLKCPQCRVETWILRSEVKKIPNDHRVIQMIDFMTSAQAKSQNVCGKHEGQPLNFFCKKCLIPVCRDCTVLDHKESQEHVIVDAADALRESAAEFDDVQNKSKEVFDRMRSRSDALANASKRLDLKERRLREQIKETFIEYRLLLERRQEAMARILHETVQQQKAAINGRFMEVCQVVSQLQSMHDQFTKARSAADIKQLYVLSQQIKEKENEFRTAAEGNDDNLFVTAEFDVATEAIFLSELSGLGEVSSKPDAELKLPVPAHELAVLEREERRERERAQERERTQERERAQERMQIPPDSDDQMAVDFDHDDDVEDDDDDDDEQVSADVMQLLAARILERHQMAQFGMEEGGSGVDADRDEDTSQSPRLMSLPRFNPLPPRRLHRRPGRESGQQQQHHGRDHTPTYMVDTTDRERGRDSREGREARDASSGRTASSSSSSNARSSRVRVAPSLRVVRHPSAGSMPTSYAALAGRYAGGQEDAS